VELERNLLVRDHGGLDFVHVQLDGRQQLLDPASLLCQFNLCLLFLRNVARARSNHGDFYLVKVRARKRRTRCYRKGAGEARTIKDGYRCNGWW